jgi:hypothetical protein
MMQQATSIFYVRDGSEQGQPARYQSSGHRSAVRLHAGRNPLPELSFDVWSELEWQNGEAPANFTAEEMEYW